MLRLLFLALLLFSVTALPGVKALGSEIPSSLNFVNIVENQNIALGEAEAIVQDHQGFMWFGGPGALLRYDGYELQTMFVLGDDSSIETPVSQVVHLFEDSENTLWVGTRAGLLKYNREKNIFLDVTPADGIQVDVFTAIVNKIIQSPSGKLLVGTYNGLYLVDPTTLNSTAFNHDPDNPSTIGSNVVRDMIFDENGVLWLATEAGLTRLDWETKTFKNYVPYDKKAEAFSYNNCWDLSFGPNGHLWLGSQKGLYKFDRTTERFSRYGAENYEKHNFRGERIVDLLLDDQNHLWVGTDKWGVYLFDPSADRFVEYASDGKRGALATNAIRSLYQDKNGDIWVGNYPSGINYHDRSTRAMDVLRFVPGSEITLISDHTGAILESGNGDLWIGAGGVTKIQAADGAFVQYYSGGELSKIDSGAILSGLKDSHGRVWFGTWDGGLHLYNADIDRFEVLPYDKSLTKRGLKTSKALNDSIVWSIFEDRAGQIWIGTHNGGLSRYDRETGTFHIYELQQDNFDKSISNELVWGTFEDSKNRFWVATASGVDLMDRERGTFKHYSAMARPDSGLPPGSVFQVCEDSKNRLWFGTDSGLYQYIEESDNFQNSSRNGGFASLAIRSITEDNFGRLWMGSSNGVITFNPDSGEIHNYQELNGEIIGGFNNGAIVHTQDGKILVGGPKGVYSFDTLKLTKNNYIPPVVLTDFKLFTESVPIGGEDNILSKTIGLTEELTVDYTKTMLTFNFAALSYRNPEKNQFAYKLEGFDEQWRFVGNQRTASYTNLDAGNYVFRVKASNNDGVWNEEGVSIRLNQLPPPWRTSWAYLIYSIIICAAIALFVKHQSQKRLMVERQNRLLEKRVAERTSELQEKNSDIQAMLGNMRQGLFTVVPGGNIHQEYSEHLETIFNARDLAGKNAIELLFSNSNFGKDRLNQIKEVFSSVIGGDTMNFDFNSHLLPSEYAVRVDAKLRFLTLDWSPILAGAIVQKLMVSVRDVTQLKEVEKEAHERKRELDIIGQLLNLSAKKFLSFINMSRGFLEENKLIIRNAANHPRKSVDNLFRNMHTIKGNARTHGFEYVSEAAHSAETYYSEIKTLSYEMWDLGKLEGDVGLLEDILNEYESIYKNALGRGGNRESDIPGAGFWAHDNFIQEFRSYIKLVEQRFPSIKKMGDVPRMACLINQSLSTPLPEVLADLLLSLPALARHLDKTPPDVVLKDGGIRIIQTSEDLINNIFSHILRNAIDHGIEPPDIRVRKGKPENGEVVITAQEVEDSLELLVKDDGQGMNLAALYKKGLSGGLWKPEQSVSLQALANLIFSSGLTTRTQVSDISGRGVGMDAVKQFINDGGGDIRVQFPSNTPEMFEEGMEHQAFSLVINLPKQHYFVSADCSVSHSVSA